MKLITQAVATNIAAHAKEAWHYSVPNDDAGEAVIREGLRAFYSDVEQRGGSTTIVDVKAGDVAYDIKCRDVLGIITKAPTKAQLESDNQYVEVASNLYVKIPNSVLSPVRRPNVEHENFSSDPQTVILDQITEYTEYAKRTTEEAGCTSLNSIIFLYGQSNGYKAIYIEEQEFSAPAPTGFDTYVNKQGKAAGYNAYDANAKILYKLLEYSKGSVNFNKRFDVNGGYLYVWPSTDLPTEIITEDKWQEAGNFVMEVTQKS
jgi:gamma-glutamylcyclotransferase (GGCT)/AIG2-like uncharacterized protein YtfP